ncbi:hypothetical protein AVEN_120723-1 [Araneus ventricosus]|uniref:Uncharacterized protein n=1 Tax=Araneus ventricosus TaxID=182803 RepID=A0A4Y2JL34_ARAVE|nr:hypothetical protein AVEN_120723-1 [Araneus ventricosus]
MADAMEPENKLHSVKPLAQPWSSLTDKKADTLVTRLRIGDAKFTHLHLLLGEQPSMCSPCDCHLSVRRNAHISMFSVCNFFKRLQFQYQLYLIKRTTLTFLHFKSLLAALWAGSRPAPTLLSTTPATSLLRGSQPLLFSVQREDQWNRA